MGGARMEEGASRRKAQARRHICSWPPHPRSPFPCPEHFHPRIWGEGLVGSSEGQERAAPREYVPRPSGQMELSIQGGVKQPPSLTSPPPPPHCLVPRWAGGAG